MKNIRMFAALVLLVVFVAAVVVAGSQTASAIEKTIEAPADPGFTQAFLPLIPMSFQPAEICPPALPPDVAVVTDLGLWEWGDPTPAELPGPPCPNFVILGSGDLYGVPEPFGAPWARMWDHTQNPAAIDLQRAGTFRLWEIWGTPEAIDLAVSQLVPNSGNWQIPVQWMTVYGPSDGYVGDIQSFYYYYGPLDHSGEISISVQATGNPSSPLCGASTLSPDCSGADNEINLLWNHAGAFEVTVTVTGPVNSVSFTKAIEIIDETAPTATATANPTATPTSTPGSNFSVHLVATDSKLWSNGSEVDLPTRALFSTIDPNFPSVVTTVERVLSWTFDTVAGWWYASVDLTYVVKIQIPSLSDWGMMSVSDGSHVMGWYADNATKSFIFDPEEPTATPTATPSPTTLATATPTATTAATATPTATNPPTATPTNTPEPTATPSGPAEVEHLGLWMWDDPNVPGSPNNPTWPPPVPEGSVIFGSGDIYMDGTCAYRTWVWGEDVRNILDHGGNNGTFNLWRVTGSPEAIAVAVGNLPHCH